MRPSWTLLRQTGEVKNVEMRLDNASMRELQRIEPTFEGVKVRDPDLARPMCVRSARRTGFGLNKLTK
jgi:hypothetical protein